jgi:ABC-type lipopolysaccharide export system ATPase subunit
MRKSGEELAEDEMVKKLYLGEGFSLDRYIQNKIG